tara:strand:+ start:6051 stop:6881 length:831 start_codon:yes stop_codon:yes gene_type:complete
MRILLSLLAVIITLIILFPSGLHLAGLHPKNTHEFDFNFDGKKALIVATNHGILNKPGELGGKMTGVFLSELSVPYYHFLEAGMNVDIASIKGGEIPVEPIPFFIKTPEDKAFESNNLSVSKLKNSLKISNLDFKEYSIIFIAGGWGAAYDLGFSEDLGTKISDAYFNTDALIGAICHGVLGFINAKKPNGDYLISGKRMTGVTDKQIKELGIAFTPMHPETELKKVGVKFESNTRFRDMFANHTVVDEEKRFITSQNQNGGHDVSFAILQILENQ